MQEIKILTPTGFQQFDGIKKYFHQTYLKFIFEDDCEISSSLDHKFIIEGKEKFARDVLVGEDIGKIVKSIEIKTDGEYFYDPLNVKNGSIYCHDDGLISHNSFIGSAGTLISPSHIKNLVHSKPLSSQDDLKIYEYPTKEDRYAVIVDSSEGLGMDYHAVNIIKITTYPYEQVAIYRSNDIDHHLLPDIIFKIGNLYNNAYVLCELNSTGEIVSAILFEDLEYDNLLFTISKGNRGQVLGAGFSGKMKHGVKTSAQTKRIGCAVLKTLIENGRLILHDFDTISELTTFIRKKQSYEAEAGHYDDCVMTLVLFAWMTNQQYFKDDLEQNLHSEMSKKFSDELDEMLVPFGVIDGGFNEISQDSRYNTHTEEIWTPNNGTFRF